jgi:hypothetical protein
MLTMETIVGLAAAGALAGLAFWRGANGILALRGKRLVACPETGRPAVVQLDLRYSALPSAFGRPHFRLKGCSRWPERRGCGQVCLSDLESAPHDRP